MKKILDVGILMKNSRKNFGQHLLKNCCATNVFVKINIFFLPNFGGRSKWKILNVKKLSWVQHIWFLSTLTSLESIKKTGGRSDKRHKQKAARKKLAGIFGKFFWFYMVFNVPIILYKMLLYCLKMLFMMQTTKFDNIVMLQIKFATFYLWWKFWKNAKKHAVLQQDLKNRFFWIKCVPDVQQ